MNRQEFSGKTLDDALGQASRVFGVDRSLLNYKVLNAQGSGLFSRIFNRNVRIEAWHESGEEDLQVAAREAVREVMKRQSSPTAGMPAERESRPADSGNQRPRGRSHDRGERADRMSADRSERAEHVSSEQNGRSDRNDRNRSRRGRQQREGSAQGKPTSPQNFEPKKAKAEGDAPNVRAPAKPLLPLTAPGVPEILNEFTGQFLKLFDIPSEKCVRTIDNDGNCTLAIEDEFMESLLTRSDKMSGAFEHLFKRIAQKRVGDVGGRIALTSGNAEEKRQDYLKEFALSVAEKVRRTGRSFSIVSKTSQERRVIHLSLDGFPGVATRSVGVGDRRKLIIYPTDTASSQRKKNQNRGGRKPQLSDADRNVTPISDAVPGKEEGAARNAGRGGKRRNYNPQKKRREPQPRRAETGSTSTERAEQSPEIPLVSSSEG